MMFNMNAYTTVTMLKMAAQQLQQLKNELVNSCKGFVKTPTLYLRLIINEL